MNCEFCGKECKNKNSLAQHEIRCKDNPNHINIKSPNKSEKWLEAMHNRRGHGSNQYIKAKELGLPKPEISEETKKRLSEKFSGDKNPAKREDVRNRISEKQKENYKGKSIFNINRSQEPFSEKYFREWLEKENIDYKKNYHVDRFYLDFAFPDKKIYFEVNGEQHYRKMYDGRDYQERDKERENILLSSGWKCVTSIRWSFYMSISTSEKEIFLDKLKDSIKTSSTVDFDFSYLSDNKKLNSCKREEAIKLGKVNSIGRICDNKITDEEMNCRKEAILNSGVDLSKFGWIEKVSKVTSLTRRQIYKIVNSTDLINYVYRR